MAIIVTVIRKLLLLLSGQLSASGSLLSPQAVHTRSAAQPACSPDPPSFSELVSGSRAESLVSVEFSTIDVPGMLLYCVSIDYTDLRSDSRSDLRCNQTFAQFTHALVKQIKDDKNCLPRLFKTIGMAIDGVLMFPNKNNRGQAIWVSYEVD